MRVDEAFGDEGGTDRYPLAGVQVREADRLPHAVEARAGVELAQRFAFHPRARRSDQAYGSFKGGVHGGGSGCRVSARTSRGMATGVGIAPTPPAFQTGVQTAYTIQ